MENTLIDRQALEDIAYTLLVKKYPGQPAETLNEEREKIVMSLDDTIGQSIVDALSEEQLDKYHDLLITEKEDPGAFERFFNECGINLTRVVAEATERFKNTYLGGDDVQ